MPNVLKKDSSCRVYDCCLVRPFLSEEDYQKTEQIVREFEQGVGKELHNQLLEVARNKQNWVCSVVLSIEIYWLPKLVSFRRYYYVVNL